MCVYACACVCMHAYVRVYVVCVFVSLYGDHAFVWVILTEKCVSVILFSATKLYMCTFIFIFQRTVCRKASSESKSIYSLRNQVEDLQSKNKKVYCAIHSFWQNHLMEETRLNNHNYTYIRTCN